MSFGHVAAHLYRALGGNLLSLCALRMQHCTCWQQSVVQKSLPSLLSPLENVKALKRFSRSNVWWLWHASLQQLLQYFATFSQEMLLVEEGRGVVHPSNLCSAGCMLSNYDYSGEKNRR